jgi:hypothetical protein
LAKVYSYRKSHGTVFPHLASFLSIILKQKLLCGLNKQVCQSKKTSLFLAKLFTNHVFIFRITIGWLAGARYLAKILEISNLALCLLHMREASALQFLF